MDEDELHRKNILAAAEEMIEAGLIKRSVDENGEEVWTITDEGRDWLALRQEHEGR
jgi:DNA-binding PadR family transcriptional regulator